MKDEDFFPDFPKLNKLLLALKELGAYNPSDSWGWELRRLVWAYKALMKQSPFKVGEYIVMTTDYPMPPGWSGYEEMMQPGAKAEVKDVEWTASQIWDKDADPGDGFFSITVQFEEEFRIGYDGEVRYADADKRSYFRFGHPERYWKLADPVSRACTIQEKLEEMELHDATGDPSDAGYMAAVEEIREWLSS